MSVYYQDEWTTLYHADCRDVLPTLAPGSVDLILADPPYGIAWAGGPARKRFPWGDQAMAGDDGSLPLLDILRDSLRVLRKQRHLYVFGLTDWGDLPIGGRCELIWDKGIIGIGNLVLPWGPQHERIAFGVYTPSRANQRDGDGRLAARLRRGSVLRCDRPNATAVTRHPTEKPVPILRQMIEASSLLGETVLDPFTGSGSTLVAAKLEGRHSVGIEIEERYCEVAANRLRQGVMTLLEEA